MSVEEEQAPGPSDEDMLAGLDAYGHLDWMVGYDNEHGDWLACFDFAVFEHPERGVLVAYHTVVNSDSAGFVDTLEACVVEAAKAPYGLPDYWSGIGQEHSEWSEEDLAEAHKINDAWNEKLRVALAAAGA